MYIFHFIEHYRMIINFTIFQSTGLSSQNEHTQASNHASITFRSQLLEKDYIIDTKSSVASLDCALQDPAVGGIKKRNLSSAAFAVIWLY